MSGSRSSRSRKATGGWTRRASAPRSGRASGHRPGGGEHLGDFQPFRRGTGRRDQEAAGGECPSPRGEHPIAHGIAHAKSSPCVCPDRHSRDGLAGHPCHVTVETRSVNLPAAPERYGHRRDQPPRQLLHRDRHGDLIRFHGAPQHASGLPASGSAHTPERPLFLNAGPMQPPPFLITRAMIPRVLGPDPSRSAPSLRKARIMSTPFDFSIPEDRLLLTQFPRVVRPRNSPRLPHRLTSHRIPQHSGLDERNQRRND